MIVKRLIRPERLRRVPQGFNWVDHRLVSQNFINRCDHRDAAIGRRLSLDPLQLAAARQQLVQSDLIAYQQPLYQVLALEGSPGPVAPPHSGQVQSAGDILRRLLNPGGSL